MHIVFEVEGHKRRERTAEQGRFSGYRAYRGRLVGSPGSERQIRLVVDSRVFFCCLLVLIYKCPCSEVFMSAGCTHGVHRFLYRKIKVHVCEKL